MFALKLNTWLKLTVLIAAVSLVCSCSVAATQAAQPKSVGEKTEHVIYIEDMQFSPARLEVNLGDTIIWINRDFIPHTATADDTRWDSGTLAQGEKSSIVVDSDTLGQYFCRFHPGMTAELLLKSM